MRFDRLCLVALAWTWGCGDDGGGGETTDTSTTNADATMTTPTGTASSMTATTATTAGTATTATTQGTSTAGDTTSTTMPPTSSSDGSSDGSTTSFQCISEDEAIDIAVLEHHPQIVDPDETHIVPPVVDNGAAGYTIQVCDLNIECPCRPDEGWLVDVNCEGVITSDTLLGQCPFG